MNAKEPPDEVIAELLNLPNAADAILTHWSHCSLTGSPNSTLGRGALSDLPIPTTNARTVLRLGDTQPADYLISGRLGEGGMGIVFEAEQVYFGRRVALKMIKPTLATDSTAVKAFFREAVITSKLDHPGIIPVVDFGVSQDGRALYAMLKTSGIAWQRVKHEKTLSENLAIFDHVAEVVAYAHSCGILHRDIKPSNVLLGEHGEIWLCDWGIALARQANGTYSHAGPAGTPQYMAPEMACCIADAIGPASDIYLLGAVLFELVTGYPPHGGDNIQTALVNSAQNIIQPVTQTNGLLQVAHKAMARLPEQRYATVAAFRKAVKQRLQLNESVYRQQQADRDFAKARETGDYELFQKAIAGYDESFALSAENVAAKQQRTQALMEYAEKALAKNEFDLAASIVQSESGVDKRIIRMMHKIALEKATSAQRRRQRAWVVIAFSCMLITIFAGGIFLYGNRSGNIEHTEGPSIDSSASYPQNKINGAPILDQTSKSGIDAEEAPKEIIPATPSPPEAPESITSDSHPPSNGDADAGGTFLKDNTSNSMTLDRIKNASPQVNHALENDLLRKCMQDFPQRVLTISPGNRQYDAEKGKMIVDIQVAINKDAYRIFIDELSTVLTQAYGAPRKTRSRIKSGVSYGRGYIIIELIAGMLDYNYTNRERFIFLCESVNDSRTTSEWLIFEPGKEAIHKFQKALQYKELYVALKAADGVVITSEQVRLFYPVPLSSFTRQPSFNASAILPLLQDMNSLPVTAAFGWVQPGTFIATVSVVFDVSPEEAAQATTITWEVIETKSPNGFK